MRISTPLLLLCLLVSAAVKAQTWTDVSDASLRSRWSQSARTIIPRSYRTVSANEGEIITLLHKAPHEHSATGKGTACIIAIPMPNGTFQHFRIVEYNIAEPSMLERFPMIKTYRGQGIEDPTATINLDWTAAGFHAMILSSNNGSVWIDPYAKGNTSEYISYYKKDLAVKPFHEDPLEIVAKNAAANVAQRAATGGVRIGAQLRTFRLAVACTGEYAQAVGGTTTALLHSAIVTTVNRVNGVYEKELAVRLVLVGNNNVIEFNNAATDPFAGNNNASVLINESERVIDSAIGSSNYDIGHTFSTGAGGLAALGVVCRTGLKGKGVTGSPRPTGDAYDIDYVAHEIGHQFGANHTFNATTGACSGNGVSTTNAEPGSGTTIMAYAGICTAANDLQPHSDPIFHPVSFNEIQAYLAGTGATCATITNTGNNPPTVAALANYTIPVSTPFQLSGNATDGDNDALTYSWDQIDVAGPFGSWNAATGEAPLFRSFNPTSSPARVFPKMSDIVKRTTTIGEMLANYARDINFRLTARDNRSGGGGVAFANMKVTTAGTTAFTVTSQAAPEVWTANNTNKVAVTWNVAGTTAAPFNVDKVDILLSTDGGYTYPVTLVAATDNDGIDSVLVPSVATTSARIMVRAVGNVFFNINSSNFTITAPCLSVSCPQPYQRNVNTCSDTITTAPPYITTCTGLKSVTWKITGAMQDTSAATGINYLPKRKFNAGVSTVTYYVEDSSGQKTSCSFTVTVLESIKPTIVAPANIKKYVSDNCTPAVYVPKPTMFDNCIISSLTWKMSGATTGASASTGINYIGAPPFNYGVTNVSYTVVDRSGNTASCSFTVTVSDTTRPKIDFIPNITVYTAYDSCVKTVKVPNPVVKDPCGLSKLTWTMSGATGGASSPGGINYVGTKTFGAGETTITYTATDIYGNVATRSFIVRVKLSDPTRCGHREAPIVAATETRWKLSPNPTANYFTLHSSETSQGRALITVFSSSGKRLESFKATPAVTLQFGNGYPAGIYILEVRQGDKRTMLTGIKN